jgi:hypothetical protein
VRLDRVIVVLVAAATLAGGLLVVHSGNGEAGKVRTKADIISCHYVQGAGQAAGHEECDGFWNTKGDPVLGSGRHVNGTIDGADVKDIGRTLTVYAKGDKASTPHGTNWPLAIFLFLVAAAAVFTLARDSTKPSPAAG